MTKSEAEDLCRRHAEALAEHFDSVQILTTYRSGKETAAVAWGSGDWYARRGMAQEFISRAHADNIASKIAPPDDSESWRGADA